MSIVLYNQDEKPKDSWVRWILYRIRQNKNCLITVVGATGSGKTWSAMSICEKISERNKVPFGVDNIIFGLKELMSLINSGDLKKGSCIIFDEPQVSISAREFQSQANKVFNYLLTTFRNRNFILFFCTPYEDLLDKTARKLFHAKFLTISINRNTELTKLKPFVVEYNSKYQKFYEKYLRISFRKKGFNRNTVVPLRLWEVPKPSKELIKVYEHKKMVFTTKLNVSIEKRLEFYEKENDVQEYRKELTRKQEDVLITIAKYKGKMKPASEELKMGERNVYFHRLQSAKKGYKWEEFIYEESPTQK